MRITYIFNERDVSRYQRLIDQFVGRRVFFVAFAVCGLFFLGMGISVVPSERVGGGVCMMIGALALLRSIPIVVRISRLRSGARELGERSAANGWEIDEQGITVLPAKELVRWRSFRRAHLTADGVLLMGHAFIWIPQEAFPGSEAFLKLNELIENQGIPIIGDKAL